jgi:hypothetical protein
LSLALSFGKRATIPAGVVALAVLLLGCTTSTKIGWISSVRSTEYSATYASYNGTEMVPISVRIPQVTFTYQVKVSKGALSIAVQDPQGHDLWRTRLTSSGSGTRTLNTPSVGNYPLKVEGEDTSGSFDIHWG